MQKHTILLFLITLFVSGETRADSSKQKLSSVQSFAPMQFRYTSEESSDDKRYSHHWKVLNRALELTVGKFGPYKMSAVAGLTEFRQKNEIASGDQGQINTMVLDLGSVPEEIVYPVRIPVDKGLLGYRVFLIQGKDQVRFDKVKTLDDLKGKFTVGQGAQWIDVKVYKNSGFQVIEGSSYNGLFGMLMSGRFDMFGRGISEVLEEFRTFGAKHNGLAIEKNLLLYYPNPIYFLFPKTEVGKKMADRVHEGMLTLIQSGEFDRLFKEEYSSAIEVLRLKERILFKIPNPTIPVDESFKDERLWYKVQSK